MYSHLEAPGTATTIAHCKAQDLPIGQLPPGSDGNSIIHRVMARIGSDEDGGRLCMIGKNIQFLKKRLWEGIIPMTQQRWQEKQLHKPDHFDFACQHLTAVIAVFQYLNTPSVRNYLRSTFNLIYDHWTEADTLLNHRRAERGEERISVAGLWTTYMAAHFEMMTERAHRWVTVQVNALRAPLLHNLKEHRPLNEDAGPDRLQWRYTDSLHMLLQIAADADYTIMIPMEGFKGYTAPQRTGPKGLHAEDCLRRGKAYHDRLKLLTREYMVRDIRSLNVPGPGGSGHRSSTSGESYHELAMTQIQGQNQLRREMRGAPIEPIPREPWIPSAEKMIKASRETNSDAKFGMAVYRLTYGQTETEWAAFVKKLDAHVSDWGKGQTGSSAIKPHLKLYWFDGKDLGIPEDDIDAAKKHFNSTINKEEDPQNPRIETRAFFAIDSASYSSYTTNSYGPSTSMVIPGDFAGFLLAVDPDFDAKEGIERPDESPEYSGQMRVLGSLIWSDLYSLFSSQTAQLEDFWPLAMEHPNQVYVGPTVPWQLYTWRKQSQMRWELLREVVNYGRRNMGLPVPPRPPVPVRAPESTPAPSPATPPQQPEMPGADQDNCSASMNAANPPEERGPVNAALRTYMLSEFRRYLRANGQNVQAAMATELLGLQPGEQPDGERIRRLVDEEERRQEQRRRDGLPQSDEDGREEYQPECPLQ
ncbi:hypothetical protein N7522_013026 [Penicillium canescens]|uniref:uncharacterized protein n=1 Tax=Penicillium canescens TaxID=5083 RepID=UPI0026DF15BF|nr:uncharacterized protein N7446_012913 [Penicillium canescens]KAJ5985830.1 hypothetical protein N7522_013026 [Penicillium canescens]KAJ6041847.1 hypothetical protein N7446_012913 [Penicillium canescens]